MAQGPEHQTYDVVIVGGAMLGSSAAWWTIRNPDFKGRILVVERDPTYEWTSTAHTNSCIRQQFSNPINVRISQFGAEFIHNFAAYFDNDPRVPKITLQSFGYLYLADTEAGAAGLKGAQGIQAAAGAATRHMSRDDIAAAYPFYHLDDIVAGNHNLINEGYFDGATIFDWWKRGAREMGVEYINNEVVAMTKSADGRRVESVTLASGDVISCGHVVNASGPRAGLTAAMAGIDIPVEPRKRYTYIYEAAKPLDRDLPLTIDPSGVHMRSDGRYYLAGCPPDDDPAVAPDNFVTDHSLWEEKVWPVLAHRVPQFEAIKLRNMWVGHYAYNTLDQNAILGPHSKVANFIFVNGFSGHGFQQSPAMGRGVSELLIYGEFRTLNLGAFHYDRIARGEKFPEKAII